MSISDELKKLENLRWNGTLTDEEFTRAKTAILAQLSQPTGTPPVDNAAVGLLEEQLEEVRYQNELARIDREWEIVKEKYTVPDRFGRKHPPTAGFGWVMALVGGVFGFIWTVMAIAITSSAPAHGPFLVAKVAFPLCGIVFMIMGISVGMHQSRQEKLYNDAFANYQRNRAAVKRPG